MHKTIEEVNKLCEIQKKLTEMLECEVNEGKEYMALCADKVGEISDMVKDMAEAAKDTMKKKYYEMLICDMMREDEEMDEVGRMGYDNRRYSSGKFAPKGKGRYVGHGSNLRMGYPWPHNMRPYDPLPFFEDEDMHDMSRDYRMGYPINDIYRDFTEMKPSEKGRLYDEYQMARKHYTSSHDEKDHRDMDDKIIEHTMEASETMGEMWRDASPETRKQMKMSLGKLLDAWEKG